jgi:hypothetical protein
VFFIGAGALCYDVAHGAILPLVVKRELLIDANSALALTQSIAIAVGPVVCGLILQFYGSAVSAFFCLGIFTLSAAFLHSLGRTEPTGRILESDKGRGLNILFDGFRYVFDDPLLRRLMKRHVLWHLLVGGIYSQTILFFVTRKGYSPSEVGVLLSCIGAGTIVAALFSGKLSYRIGVGPSIVLSNFLAACFSLLITLSDFPGARAAAMLGAVLFVHGFCFIVYQVNNAALRQSSTPSAMMGQMTATVRVGTMGANALGAIVSGGIAEYLGTGQAIAIFSAGAFVLSVLGLFIGPVRSIVGLPQAHQ